MSLSPANVGFAHLGYGECELHRGFRGWRLWSSKCTPYTLLRKEGALRGKKDLPRYACLLPIWRRQTALASPCSGGFREKRNCNKRGDP
ncbi:hypothetical protein D3C85_669270 [compost metagenome]